MKKALLLRWIVSLTAVSLLAFSVDPAEALKALGACDPTYLLFALGLMFLSRILMPLKFSLLLQTQAITLPVRDNFRIYYLSSFAGLFLPATLGADALRIYCLKSRGINVLDTVPAVVLERAIGLLVTCLFGFLGALSLILISNDLSFSLRDPARGWLAAVLLTLLGTSALSYAALKALCGSKIMHSFAFLRRTADYLQNCSAKYRKGSLKVAAFSVLTAAEALLAYTAAWLAVESVGAQVPAWYVFAFLPVQFLILRLPVSIAGWGVPQLGFVYFLSQAGVPAAAGLTAGVLHQLLLSLAVLPGLFPFILEFGSIKPSAAQAAIDASAGKKAE